MSHSLKLRSLLGLPEKDTCVDVLPEETVEVKQPIKGGKEDKITSRKEERRSICGKDREDKKRTTKTAGKEKEEFPNSRKSKVKDEKKLKSSTSSQKVKEVAQRVEAVVTDPIEPPQDQVDPILYGTYQEKLYIEVYGLLDSMQGEKEHFASVEGRSLFWRSGHRTTKGMSLLSITGVRISATF